MADPLFDIKTYFYLGNYQMAINEGQKIRPKDENVKLEKDYFLYRCFIEQGNYQVVLDEIKPNSPPTLQAVRALAQFSSGKEPKDRVLQTFKDLLQNHPQDDMVRATAALALYSENQLEESLRCLHQNARLEARALVVQIFLQIARIDLAERELAAMKEINVFAVPSQLASAWVNLATNGEKPLQDARLTFQDLIDKYGASPMLLNGIAVSFLHQKKYSDCEGALLQSLERNNKVPETLINLIVVSQYLSKPADQINRYLAQLKSIAPNHQWLQSYARHEEMF
jgi:hypothetical protein